MNAVSEIETAPHIQMRGIVKEFPGVVANDKVDLDLRRGEIHALLGENGAGKTTLMNVLYGVYPPDRGEILIDGKKVEIHTPKDAIGYKISMIHQNFMQIPTLTVTENIILGLPNRIEPFIDFKSAEERIVEIARSLGFQAQPRALIRDLTVGDRQRVEIIKAIYREAEVMILDEPTSVLTPQGTEELFSFLRELLKTGLAIVFITHKLKEIMRVSDRVTVLRHGRKVDTISTSLTDPSKLSRLMMGGVELAGVKWLKTAPRQEILRVEGLDVRTPAGIKVVDNVSFTVRACEIVGVAGVTGNGQSELNSALFGLMSVDKGKIIINGKDLTGSPPSAMLAEGVGFVPEDWDEGLLNGESIWENTILDCHHQPAYSNKFGFLLLKKIWRHAEEVVSSYNVKAPSINATTECLSGGNKQKLILGRELIQQPKLLIAAHPTRGLDVGAEEYIQQQLELGKEEGMGILLISTKLDEIMKLSDRIMVMFEGRVMDILEREEATVEKIGLLMAGIKGSNKI